ncbi:ABC transporter ATP-binding protein [Subdoligranulum variabile]|nr:sn-glycerol-3-phosphate ABC transporter ATP-binding protein UgpC [Subdoligranulum variabile]UWP67275.1 sn-glycerol-3-phosphate ABC transporter ATP-binding protein UgpC [Subdoligranulum variabile]
MAEIVLKDVCKVFEKDQYAVSNFSLRIRDGEFIVFVGPSGCGKSTTLRMIAGLEDITSGELWIGDRLCNYADPGERDLSMVFQNYALYPQMSVYDNMAFALSVRKVPKKEIRQRVETTAEMLGISHLLSRRPSALSGGQKQRVAIGSAILRKPKAFLMDEPLSNLDAKLRTHMRVELAALHHKLGTTTIYVTHDQTEAMTLADRIVVMKAGYIQQVATPVELYNRPTNMFVAGFIGSPAMSFLRGKVRRAGDGAAFLTEAGQVFPLTAAQAKVLWPQYDNRALVLGIRPEDLYAAPARTGRLYGKMQGMITACESLGHEAILHLETEDGEFAARVEPGHGAAVDQPATLYLDMANAHFFDGEAEQNIFYQWRNEE